MPLALIFFWNITPDGGGRLMIQDKKVHFVGWKSSCTFERWTTKSTGFCRSARSRRRIGVYEQDGGGLDSSFDENWEEDKEKL